MTQALAGKGVLVTRPAGQAQGLMARLAELGARPVFFPCIEIAGPVDPASLDTLIERLDTFDWAIFVSPTAAEWGMRRIQARRTLPEGLRIAAVGGGTARALAGLGAKQVLAPEAGADSESLLALAPMQAVAGQRIAIFRGEGGRELLAETLRSRGAEVHYAECYRRVRPVADPAPLLADWARGGIDAVTVTSAEGLANLFAILGEAGAQWLRATPLFAPHERIAQAARGLGVGEAVATPPGDAGMIEALQTYFGREHEHS